MSMFFAFMQVAQNAPRMATMCLSAVVFTGAPMVAGGIACIFSLMKDFFAGIAYGLVFLWKGLQCVQLPFARTFGKVALLLKDAYKAVNNVFSAGLPIYLQPVAWLARKLIRITYFLAEFLANILPLAIVYLFVLIIWYAFIVPFVLALEVYPAEFNDTIDLFVQMFRIILNFPLSLYNVMVGVVNPLLPLSWMFTNQLAYWIQMGVNYVGSMFALNNWRPVANPEFTTMARSIGDTAAGMGTRFGRMRVLLGDEAMQFTPYPLQTRREAETGFDYMAKKFESADFYALRANLQDHPVLRTFFPPSPAGATRRRRLQETGEDSNPAFTFFAPSQIDVATSRFYESVIIFFFSVIEILGCIFYMFVEVMLVCSVMLKHMIMWVILGIPKGLCATQAPWCAIKEMILVLINAIIENIFFLPPLQGCSGSELNAVSCQCSTKEGGIFPGKAACPVEQFVCTTSSNGEVLQYQEFRDGDKTPLTVGSTVELGCPHHGRSGGSGRRLESIGCVSSCIYLPGQTVGSQWRVCGGDRHYTGACSEERKDLVPKINADEALTKKLVADYVKHMPGVKLDILNKAATERDKTLAEIPPGAFADAVDYLLRSEASQHPSCKAFWRDEKIDRNYVIGGMLVSDFMYSVGCLMEQAYTLSLADMFSTSPKEPYHRVLLEDEEVEEEKPAKRKLTFVGTYVEPFKDLAELATPDAYWPGVVDKWWDNVIDRHSAFMADNIEGYESILKTQRGFHMRYGVSLTNVVLSHLRESDLDYQADKHAEARRRDLQQASPSLPGATSVDPSRAGRLIKTCGEEGYLCPNGECAPFDDPKKCTPCAEYSGGCLLRSPGHFFVTTEWKFDAPKFYREMTSCWVNIMQNRNKNPVTAVSQGRIRLNASGYYIPSDVVFCIPMIPPLPLAPLFTWSWTTFVKQKCGITDVTQRSSACSCPQYMSGSLTGVGGGVQWIVGIPFSTSARLYNAYKAFQFMFTQATPGFIGNVWYYMVSLFCNPEICAELANVFNRKWAMGGASEATNYFCVAMNFGSVMFTLAFFVAPLVTIVLYGRKLLWEIATLVMDPVYYFTMLFFDILHFVNSNVRALPYPETLTRILDQGGGGGGGGGPWTRHKTPTTTTSRTSSSHRPQAEEPFLARRQYSTGISGAAEV